MQQRHRFQPVLSKIALKDCVRWYFLYLPSYSTKFRSQSVDFGRSIVTDRLPASPLCFSETFGETFKASWVRVFGSSNYGNEKRKIIRA